MNVLEDLRTNLTAESKAYGYTLSVWGTGAILITSYQTLNPVVILAFILGGVIGFGVLAYMAFQSIFSSFEYTHEERLLVGSMIHILASFGNVFVSYLLVLFLKPLLGSAAVFFVLGFHASVNYNVLLLVEDILFNHIVDIEVRIMSEVQEEGEEQVEVVEGDH